MAFMQQEAFSFPALPMLPAAAVAAGTAGSVYVPALPMPVWCSLASMLQLALHGHLCCAFVLCLCCLRPHFHIVLCCTAEPVDDAIIPAGWQPADH